MGEAYSEVLSFFASKSCNVLNVFLIFDKNSEKGSFLANFVRKWALEASDVLITFFNFKPLKPYVLI